MTVVPCVRTVKPSTSCDRKPPDGQLAPLEPRLNLPLNPNGALWLCVQVYRHATWSMSHINVKENRDEREQLVDRGICQTLDKPTIAAIKQACSCHKRSAPPLAANTNIHQNQK